MSRYFTGSLVSFGSENASAIGASRFELGAFDVHILPWAPDGAVAHMQRLLRFVGMLADEARSAAAPYDLIVSYDPFKTGITALRAARRLGAKVVVEVNGDYSAASNYAGIANPVLRALRRWLFLRIESFVLGRADGIKLLYPEQLEGLPAIRGGGEITAFFDFVDTGRFSNLGESPEVLLVGFPFDVKGVDILIDAFRRVTDRFPDWRLKILGWYEGEELAKLRGAIAGHPRITHHPPVPNHEVPRHIGTCGIFVLASRTEGMGRVLIEAMAASKPRIGTRVGGIPIVIEDEVDGLLVPPEDPAALADAMAKLMADPELRARMGRRSAARALSEFSPEAYVAHARSFYHRVLRITAPS
jgi:glycosyltransferase involved in cell wall biosynthesis